MKILHGWFSKGGDKYISAHKKTYKNSTCSIVEGVLMASCHFRTVKEYEVIVVEETSIDGRDES